MTEKSPDVGTVLRPQRIRSILKEYLMTKGEGKMARVVEDIIDYYQSGVKCLLITGK